MGDRIERARLYARAHTRVIHETGDHARARRAGKIAKAEALAEGASNLDAREAYSRAWKATLRQTANLPLARAAGRQAAGRGKA